MTWTRRFASAAGLFALTLFPAMVRAESILIAASRDGWVYFIDPTTLNSRGRLFTGKMTESVVASADGTTLFINKPRPSEPDGCCALYAMSLKQGTFTELLWPSLGALVVPKMDRIMTQRGNMGIDEFDTQTLARQPAIVAPGVYSLSPSPDGRWMFGANTFQGASVDIFDLQKAAMVRRIPVPGEGTLSAAWLAGNYYLYSQEAGQGHLWRVTSDATQLDAGLTINLPGSVNQGVSLRSMTAAAGHLFLYESFGSKLDNRWGKSRAGGMYEIDPTNGSVVRSLVPELHFSTVKVDGQGRKVFAIDVGTENWQDVRLVKIDRESGHVEAVRELAPDVWSISLAEIPVGLIPAT